jgi:hypothetical protein
VVRLVEVAEGGKLSLRHLPASSTIAQCTLVRLVYAVDAIASLYPN